MAALSYELNIMGYPAKIVYELTNLDIPNKKDHTLILFGYQQIYENSTMINLINQIKHFNLIIFNSEQLHTDVYKPLISIFIKDQKAGIINSVWDYSKKNVNILKKAGLQDVYLLPLGYSKAYEIDGINLGKERDESNGIFYGAMNQRRIHLINQLNDAGIPVKYEKNVWLEKYKTTIKENSIYLNIHFYKGAILELFRIVPILCNGGGVLSQKSDDPYLDQLYEPYVEFFYETIKSNSKEVVIEKRLERYQKFKDNMKFSDLIKNSGIFNCLI
jgi:hypothetical protein